VERKIRNYYFDPRLDLNYHLCVNVRVPDNLAELLEAYFSIIVLVVEQDGLVHDLLQLRVLQVVSHHHLQHLVKLTIGHETIIVNIVDPECKSQLVLNVSFGAEMRKAHDELLEVDLPVAVIVKDVNHPPDERVLLQLWQGHELLNGE